MERQKLEHWKELRKNVVMDEPLSEEELCLYEAGRAELNATELLGGNIDELRQKRKKTLELKAEYVQLQAQYQILEQKIEAYEKRLSPPTKVLLGVGN